MPERIEGRIIRGEQQNRLIAVAGRKGSGKSTLVREQLLMPLIAADPQGVRLFAYDTMGEHMWIPDTFDEQDKAVMFLMETPTFPNFVARYVPDTDDEEKDFAEICSEVFNQGNMTYLVEEVVMLGCSPNYAPPKFRRIIRLGRHRNLDVIYTTQRLEECPRLLTSQTDVFVLFAHSEPRSLERIAERCGNDVARLVADFKDHEFLIYDVNQKSLVSTVDCGSMIVPISSPQLIQQQTITA